MTRAKYTPELTTWPLVSRPLQVSVCAPASITASTSVLTWEPLTSNTSTLTRPFEGTVYCWRLNAQIVSLAACQGFSIKASVGDGPNGVGAAFLQAGARSLLVSSYAVDDAASELFFHHYAELLFDRNSNRVDAATALRAARLWLRDYRAPDGSRPYVSPAFWSGYVLVGWPD